MQYSYYILLYLFLFQRSLNTVNVIKNQYLVPRSPIVKQRGTEPDYEAQPTSESQASTDIDSF